MPNTADAACPAVPRAPAGSTMHVTEPSAIDRSDGLVSITALLKKARRKQSFFRITTASSRRQIGKKRGAAQKHFAIYHPAGARIVVIAAASESDRPDFLSRSALRIVSFDESLDLNVRRHFLTLGY